jgi:hypothetical protein
MPKLYRWQKPECKFPHMPALQFIFLQAMRFISTLYSVQHGGL